MLLVNINALLALQPVVFVRQMLDDFEELEEGQRSILRGGTRVRDVLSGLAKMGSTWWRHVAKNGMTASGFTHQIPAIRCYHGRTSSSIVKSSKALDTQFAQDKPSSMDVSGTNISTPLMKTLVNADIFVGPDAKGRFRPGKALVTALDF